MAIKPDWRSISKQKVEHRQSLIPADWIIKPVEDVDVRHVPKTCGLLFEREIEMTEMDSALLAKDIAAKKYTSEEVVTAYCKRAAIAQQLTNCLSEIRFAEAIEEAKALDKYLEDTGTVKGPLHGLPISFKDNFYVQGLDTTVGFVAWANDPATKEKESEMVKLVRDAGAIVHCKTNVPTAMMMPETYNNVFGFTVNPWNRRCGSGGSSGGESSLLAMKGSAIGVGTDIGGSVRIPAALCGLYCLKPSFGRFTTYGARSGLPGQEAVRSINGPMATSLDALELWAKTVVDAEKWMHDFQIVPMPWREVTLPEKLCFGLQLDDGFTKPLPSVHRALMETKAALEAAGHTVITYEPFEPEQSEEIIMRLFKGDGGHKISTVINQSGEDWPAGLKRYDEAYRASKDTPPLVGDMWDIQSDRTKFANGTLTHWRATAERTGTGRPIDGLIAPTTPWSAPPIYAHEYAITYTSNWNICDFSASTFPVTQTTLEDVKPDYTPRTDAEKKIWNRYDPKEVIGAPVGLQLVGLRLEEEKVLKLTRVVVDALVGKTMNGH